MELRLSTGREFAGLDDVREAVRISARHPDSAEYALAMAELAHAELLHSKPTGPARAQDAVRLARACGSATALSYALTANVMRQVIAGDQAGLVEAEEARAAAAQARDFRAFVHATLWGGNCIGPVARRDVAQHLRRCREEMASLGAPHCYMAWVSAVEAQELLLLGEWHACLERLRVVLGSSPGPMADTNSRLTSALLAGWQGRWAEAEAHLIRAAELSAEQSGFSAFDAVRAELAVATGDTERAITVALACLARDGLPPEHCERLLPLAARAAADQAQGLRDNDEDSAPAVARLRDLQRSHPTVVTEGWPGMEAQTEAMQALYDAEVLRGQADPAAARAWRRAAQTCADAELAWDEAYARWRAAEALTKDRATRDAAAAALRRAHELAVDLQAAPLLADVEALAQSARVSLAAIDESPPGEPTALPGLTPREREILGHVVAGRTYGEIARELVLSEKTVSVHVSHLLHKTGTANRVELAQLARRIASTATD
jgi:DNA-binding NarL/FixJ family response regulator